MVRGVSSRDWSLGLRQIEREGIGVCFGAWNRYRTKEKKIYILLCRRYNWTECQACDGYRLMFLVGVKDSYHLHATGSNKSSVRISAPDLHHPGLNRPGRIKN